MKFQTILKGAVPVIVGLIAWKFIEPMISKYTG